LKDKIKKNNYTKGLKIKIKIIRSNIEIQNKFYFLLKGEIINFTKEHKKQ
jgi:hypothetical protein